jgi:hypothetical protein
VAVTDADTHTGPVSAAVAVTPTTGAPYLGGVARAGPHRVYAEVQRRGGGAAEGGGVTDR